MAVKYEQEERRHCLECGDELNVGRTDKKFCCSKCRYDYHNRSHRNEKIVKAHTLRSLEKNYEILNHLLEEGQDSIGLTCVAELGFNPSIATAVAKNKEHLELGIFDIHYKMGDCKIYGLEKVSLSLATKTRKR